MSAEEWRPVVGYEGYEVSSLGRVRSLRSGQPHVLALTTRKDGYRSVGLLRPVGRHTCVVHGLVVAAFLGPRPAGYVIRHLDGEPSHNAVSNLAYGTRGDNNLDTVRHGRHPMARRTRCDQGHEFTEENTAYERTPGNGVRRRCRTCRRARQRVAA